MIDSATILHMPHRRPVAETKGLPHSGTAPTWIHALMHDLPRERERVPLRPGQLIPGTRYRIVRWRGEGGMGVVYEAEHVDMERRVAVKILRSEICHHPPAVRAFRDEARAASRIGSELIVQLYDFVELPDGRLMIAMELLEGHNLHRALRQPLELSRALGILRQVCQGLAAAHAAGVVHRDVKPENIFLTTKDGRADAVKLVDFGISAIHDGTESTAIRSGTPYYLAPEVAVHGSVAPSVDVYAFGCMAFELLTGGLPFQHEQVGDVLRAHLEQAPPRPSSRSPQLPVVFDAVIGRCLAKDPAARFPSMIEVEAALCEAQLACGVQTPWDDLPLPMVEPERRERLLALLPEVSLPAGRTRSSAVIALGAAMLLSVGAVVGALGLREPDVAEVVAPSAWVDERGAEARDAAAKALFVFPPVDEPRHATGYSIVRGLETHEGWDEAAARALATELRAEFASTLVRLGDDYWNRQGGRAFASAYYEQALLFDRERAVARERSTLSDEELEDLARRAERLAFSEPELLGAEPLVVLAGPDAASRTEQLRALQTKREHRMTALDRQLARLGGLSPAAFAVSRDDDGNARASSPPTPVVAEILEQGAPPGLQGARPDEARAHVLARQGKAALVSGRLSRAESLFEQALGHDRHNVVALAGLRDVAFERGAYGTAVKLGEQAVQGRPRDAQHRLRLGDAYFKVLRYRDALEQYERARALGERRAKWRIEKVRDKLGPS